MASKSIVKRAIFNKTHSFSIHLRYMFAIILNHIKWQEKLTDSGLLPTLCFFFFCNAVFTEIHYETFTSIETY